MRGIDVARQGRIGDCGLIATLNSLGHRAPGVLESGIVADGPTVRVGGTTVSRELPVGPDGHIAPVARSTDGSTWASLAERAVTERRGGYDAWEQGGIWPRDVFQALTGTPSRTFRPEYMTTADLARQLEEPNRAMVASTRTIKDATPLDEILKTYDLFARHAYSVREIIDGKVFLHNPWGRRHPKPVPVEDFQKLFGALDVWP